MWVCAYGCRYLWRPEEGVRAPRAGVTGAWLEASWCGCRGLTWILHKSGMYPYLLSHHSRPLIDIVFLNWKQSQARYWLIHCNMTYMKCTLLCGNLCLPLWLLWLYSGCTPVTEKRMAHWWLSAGCGLGSLRHWGLQMVNKLQIGKYFSFPTFPPEQFRVRSSTSQHVFHRTQIKPAGCTNDFRVIVEMSVECWLSIKPQKRSQTCVAIVIQYTGRGLWSVGAQS